MKHLLLVRRTWVLAALSLLATSAGRAQDFSPVAGYATGTGTRPVHVAVGDVTGDGVPDLVAANPDAATIGVLPGLGNGTFGAATTYPAGLGPQTVRLGDLNGDGQLDAVVGAPAGTAVLLGLSGGQFAPPTLYASPVSLDPGALVLVDMNGDGRLDVVSAYQYASSVSVRLGLSAGTLGPATSYPVPNTQPHTVAVGDLNGDGYPDVATTIGTEQVAVLPGTSGGGLGAARFYLASPGGAPQALALADLNGDGRLDVVTADAQLNRLSVLLNQSNLVFAPPVQYAVGGQVPLGLALADVNGDGWLDAVAANFASATVAVLPGGGGGSLGAATLYAGGPTGGPTSLTLADLDSNGCPDIVTANYTGAQVEVLLNAQPALLLGNPGSAPAGSSLTLRGNNLAGASAVVFTSNANATTTVLGSSFSAANYTASPNFITLTVPATLAPGTYAVAVSTPRGLTNARPFTVTGMLAQVPAAPLAEGLRLAPNPAHLTTTLTVPANTGASCADLHLLDGLGREVRAIRLPLPTGETCYPLELSTLPPGLYLLRVEVAGQRATRRLLVH